MTAPAAPERLARPPLDVRLAAVAAVAWAASAAGLAFSPRLVGAGVLVLAAAAVSGAVVAGARSGGPGVPATGWTVVAAAAVAAAALAIAGFRSQALHAAPLPALARTHATAVVSGVVTGDPRALVSAPRFGRPGTAYVVVPLRLERITARDRTWRVRVPVRVSGRGSGWGSLVPSQRVSLTARFGPALPGQPLAASLSAGAPPRDVGPPNLAQRVAERLRAGLREAVGGLPSGPRGLLPGLVDGDTSLLPEDLAADVQVAGLTHLSAVSGANVAIVVGAALLLARQLGVRGRALPLVGAVALAAFVELARPQPSVLRAAAMGAVALLGLLRGRRAASIPALAAAVTGLLLLDPWQARSYAFALSTIATAALLLAAPPLVAALTARRVPLRLAQALAVPVAAHLATAPVVALLSGSFSVVAIPANMVAEPLVAPATVLGVLVALLGAVSTPAAAVLAHVAALPAAAIAWDAHLAAQIPGAAVPWPATVRGALLLGLLTLLAPVAGLPLLRRRVGRVAALAAALALLGARLVAPHWPPPSWVLVACDVGQGDALVLRVGRGAALVVDAGPDPAAVGRCLDDLRITTVPLVVLTHFHADHVEGLPGVLRGRRVEAVVGSPLREPPEEVARVDAWLRPRALAVRAASVGESGALGGLRWQVLAPRAVRAGEDPNDASVVLLVDVAGLRLLLTGDVTPPSQLALHVGQPPLDRPIDVLKVPHHGSAHQDPGFLTRLGPRLALVSVGAHNDYGHPAAATLALLRQAGALVARTDRQGDLAVVPGDRGPVLVARHGGGG